MTKEYTLVEYGSYRRVRKILVEDYNPDQDAIEDCIKETLEEDVHFNMKGNSINEN